MFDRAGGRPTGPRLPPLHGCAVVRLHSATLAQTTGATFDGRLTADPTSSEQQPGRDGIGGCIETVSVLAGTAYGDLRAFASAHAPEGLIVNLEAGRITR